MSRSGANVSTLKVHLGRFLKRVANGEEIIVLDRQHPVAKLIPYSGEPERPQEIPPTATWAELTALLESHDASAPATPLKRPSIAYLEEDRDGG